MAQMRQLLTASIRRCAVALTVFGALHCSNKQAEPEQVVALPSSSQVRAVSDEKREARDAYYEKLERWMVIKDQLIDKCQKEDGHPIMGFGYTVYCIDKRAVRWYKEYDEK